MGKTARITWPQEYSELQRIHELLLCGICYEYMETSVMTPCSHNYCSLCIRKYLHYKAQCPACFEKTFEKDLHTNRILDELIAYFGKIREKLVDCIAGAKIEAHREEENAEDSMRLTPVRPARTNHNQKKTPSPRIEEVTSSMVDSPRNLGNLQKNLSFVVDSPKLLSSPSTSGTSKVASIFTPKSKNDSAGLANKKIVPCPVCRVEVSEIHVNKHLDDCLKRENATQQCARIEPKRKPLPKLVVSLMKDTALRKKMKELGLPTHGDRKTLEARFQRYSTLYNAECDKTEPRTVEQLLKQCEEDENLEKKMQKISHGANRLKINRTSEQNIIEAAQKKYLETNKEYFDNLIAGIKNREQSKKLPVRRSLVDRDAEEELVDDPTEKLIPDGNLMQMNEDDEENGDQVRYSMNDFDNLFQDSDSNSTCPLQHYTSDDPINFLSLQMGKSNDNTPVASPAKSSPCKMRRSGAKSSDARPSPAKNVVLDDSPAVKSPENTANDPYSVTTDDESTDEDVVLPSPNAATTHTTKRPKLSLQTTEKTDDPKPKFVKKLSEAQLLASMIARDFDTSSNDSVDTKPVHETADIRTTEKPSIETQEFEQNAAEVSNRGKENHKSSTPITTTVNRPVRKRNCATRACKSDRVDATKLKEATATPPESASRADVHVDEKVESPPRIDSPLKRRRGRKVVTPVETETKNPPRRPLRKRNSVIKEMPKRT